MSKKDKELAGSASGNEEEQLQQEMARNMNSFTRNLPWIVLGVMVLWLAGKVFTVPKKAFQGMDMH